MNNPVLERYIPRSFGSDLMEIKDNALQLGLYMSMILGFKPLMDDWIRIKKIDAFKKACLRYGIHVREDVIFRNLPKDKIPVNVLGRENITSTSAYGLQAGNENDEVHVFLSKKRELLKKAMWYPVIINDRVVFCPRIDHLKYGKVLGYPDCCVRFFSTYNDWLKCSYLYESYRNTRTKPSFLCNPFLKDTAFTYIYHMPCSYDCKKTIELAGKLRKEIKKREPLYVKLADQYLKMPFLVFYERKFYMFDGAAWKGDMLTYKKAHFVSPDGTKDIYGEDLNKADGLRLQGRKLLLYKKRSLLQTLDIPMENFAPEYPFLIDFKSEGRRCGNLA